MHTLFNLVLQPQTPFNICAGKGIARAAKKGEAGSFNTIGRSLANKNTDGLGEILAIVIIN